MTHKIELRVRYEETDRMGVVYYGNYLVWFEIARTEFFRALGILYRELEEKDGLRLMVAQAECVYRSPATYDDVVTVQTDISEIKNSSLSFSYKVFCGARLLAAGKTSHVFTNKEGRPVRIPDGVRKAISSA